jgi:hypothetical protein
MALTKLLGAAAGARGTGAETTDLRRAGLNQANASARVDKDRQTDF